MRTLVSTVLHQRSRLIAAGAAAAVMFGTGQVSAADPPAGESVQLRAQTVELEPVLRPWRGLEPKFGRELTWARWMMATEAPAGDSEVRKIAPWLDLAQFRDGVALLRPDAGETALTAIGSVATAGIPVLGVWRRGRLAQRHMLRGYFRGRGIAVAWRVEF